MKGCDLFAAFFDELYLAGFRFLFEFALLIPIISYLSPAFSEGYAETEFTTETASKTVAAADTGYPAAGGARYATRPANQERD